MAKKETTWSRLINELRITLSEPWEGDIEVILGFMEAYA